MPDVVLGLTIGEVLAWLAGLSALAGVLWKVWKPIRTMQTFLRDWAGKPARYDRADNVVEDAVPGVLGRLDTLRGDIDRVLRQVENSHNTNFRDDLDTVRASVEMVGHKLDEHIKISKDHDRFQEGTQEALDEHIESTKKWTVMLSDLHDKYSPREAPPDDKD